MALRRSAGILVRAEDTHRVLLCLRRADGFWATPGGELERFEEPLTAALRELCEETLYCGKVNDIRLIGHTAMPETTFWLFAGWVGREFLARLDEEHDAWGWFPTTDPPRPLHPGLKGLFR